jgi:hypothetical protein
MGLPREVTVKPLGRWTAQLSQRIPKDRTELLYVEPANDEARSTLRELQYLISMLTKTRLIIVG